MSVSDETILKSFVAASKLPAEYKDKKARKWLISILRTNIKALTSTMQALDLLKDTLLLLRDALSKLELAISEEEGEL